MVDRSSEELHRISDEQRARALELTNQAGSLIDELKTLLQEIRELYDD